MKYLLNKDMFRREIEDGEIFKRIEEFMGV